MKRQTRPFTVELKNTRKSALRAKGPAQSQDEWIDFFPDDVPERDVYEDLTSRDRAEARLEAERVFAGFNIRAPEPAAPHQEEGGPPVVSQEPVIAREAEVEAPRVLPDLFAEALRPDREGSPEPAARPRRKRSLASTTPQEEASSPPSSETELPLEGLRQAEESDTAPSLPPATSLDIASAHIPPTLRLIRRQSHRVKGLPAGQRWKERRLPRVCWDQ